MLVAAVDPGVSGAVAFINTDTKEINVFDLPLLSIGKRKTINPYAFGGTLNVHQPDVLIIENVATRPGQGISSSGNFMYGAGVLFGVAGGLDIPAEFVAPASWKRRLGLIGKSKEASRSLAIRLFPAASSHLKRKKDADRAEAILMAHDYVILKLGGYGVPARRQPMATRAASPLASTPFLLRIGERQRSSTPDVLRSGSRTRQSGSRPLHS